MEGEHVCESTYLGATQKEKRGSHIWGDQEETAREEDGVGTSASVR